MRKKKVTLLYYHDISDHN